MTHLPLSQDWVSVWTEPEDPGDPDPLRFQTRYATWD